MSLETMWEATFPERKRPRLYVSQSMNEDGFMPLSEPSSFAADGIASLTSSQLYALAANNADALATAQQEWTSLEKLASQLKNRDVVSHPVKDPQTFSAPDVFEELKESILYGYKYNSSRQMIPARFTVSENVTDQEKFDCREPPEPFGQAGLIPSDKQYRSMLSTAKAERREHNPDNLEPYASNFAFESRPRGMWLPRLPPKEEPPPYKTRTRANGQRMGLVAGGESRQTRFNGERIPSTRDASPMGLSGVGTSSPGGKRSGTPVGAVGSPAQKKRRLENGVEDISRGRQPNQYARRAEGEALAPGHVNGYLPHDAETGRRRHPNQYGRRRDNDTISVAGAVSRTNSNLSQQSAYAHQPSRLGGQGGETKRLSKEEKRSSTFKDSELVELIKQDHSWLNDDYALATNWKERILNAEYPVRTWAMLRKWHEWKRENRHKRPRNKQKVQEEEASDAGVEDNARKRPSRLRRQLDATTATPAMSSPLINGISAQDVPRTSHAHVGQELPAMDEASTQEASPGPMQDSVSDDEIRVSPSSSATADEDGDYEEATPTKAGAFSRKRAQMVTRSSYTNGTVKGESMSRTRSSRSEQEQSARNMPDKDRRMARYVPSRTHTADATSAARRSLRSGRRGST